MKKICLFFFLTIWANLCFSQAFLNGVSHSPSSEKNIELTKHLTEYELLQFDQHRIPTILNQKDLNELQITLDDYQLNLSLQKWDLFDSRSKTQLLQHLDNKAFDLYKVAINNSSDYSGVLLISASAFYLEYKAAGSHRVITSVDHFLNKKHTSEDYITYEKKHLVRSGETPLCYAEQNMGKENVTPPSNGNSFNSSSCEDGLVNYNTITTSDFRIVELALEIDPAFVTATGGGFGLLIALVAELSALETFYSAPPYNVTFVITNSNIYNNLNNPYPIIPAINQVGYDAVNAAIVSTLAMDNSFTRDIAILYTGVIHSICGSVTETGIGTFCDGSEVNCWVRFNNTGTCPNGLVTTHEVGHLFNGRHPANDEIAPPNTACHNTVICNGPAGGPEFPNLMCSGCPSQIISLDDDPDNENAIATHLGLSTACFDSYDANIVGEDVLCNGFKEYKYQLIMNPSPIFVPNIVWTVGSELTIVGSNTESSVTVKPTLGSSTSISTLTATISIQGYTLKATRKVSVNPIPQIRVSGGDVVSQCSDNANYFFNVLCPPDYLTVKGFLPGVPDADFTFQCFGEVTCSNAGNNTINISVPNGVNSFGMTVSVDSDVCGQDGRTFVFLPNYNCGWYAVDETSPTDLLNNLKRDGIKEQIEPKDWNELEQELLSHKKSIKVFPNPVASQEKLIVEVPFNIDEYELRLIDVNGKIVQTMQSSQSKLEIDISHVESGAYFIQVFNEKMVESKRIVITN